MLGLFVNILAADEMYSCHNRENFQQLVQMQLSKKLNTCSRLLIAFLESTSNSKDFEKKDESHGLSFSEIIHSHGVGYLND